MEKTKSYRRFPNLNEIVNCSFMYGYKICVKVYASFDSSKLKIERSLKFHVVHVYTVNQISPQVLIYGCLFVSKKWALQMHVGDCIRWVVLL